MSDVPGEKALAFRDFRVAYYKVRVGIDAKQNWSKMCEFLSDGPEPDRGAYFYRAEILDRFVQGTISAQTENEAIAWLEALQGRFREARHKVTAGSSQVTTLDSPAAGLRQMELMLGGCIHELQVQP